MAISQISITVAINQNGGTSFFLLNPGQIVNYDDSKSRNAPNVANLGFLRIVPEKR